MLFLAIPLLFTYDRLEVFNSLRFSQFRFWKYEICVVILIYSKESSKIPFSTVTFRKGYLKYQHRYTKDNYPKGKSESLTESHITTNTKKMLIVWARILAGHNLRHKYMYFSFIKQIVCGFQKLYVI